MPQASTKQAVCLHPSLLHECVARLLAQLVLLFGLQFLLHLSFLPLLLSFVHSQLLLLTLLLYLIETLLSHLP